MKEAAPKKGKDQCAAHGCCVSANADGMTKAAASPPSQYMHSTRQAPASHNNRYPSEVWCELGTMMQGGV